MSQTATAPMRSWKSTSEVAAMYGKDRDTIWKWVTVGLEMQGFARRLRLNARKLGGEWGIEPQDVETYFDALGGDEKALAIALQWKCNREDANAPVSETPAAANARARRDQNRARGVLGKK